MTREKEYTLNISEINERPTSENLLNNLQGSLAQLLIKTRNVIAFVSDSLFVMVKMRLKLYENHDNITPIRCCLHQMNLLTKDLMHHEQMARVFIVNSKIDNIPLLPTIGTVS